MSLTRQIMIAMAAGLVVGLLFNAVDSTFIDAYIVEGLFGMLGTMFVNALQMLVVPLVVFSLICGVAGLGDIHALGRIGGRTFALYLLTTAIAIAVAIGLALVVGPGKGVELTALDTSEVAPTMAPSVWQVFSNIVPRNPVTALASTEMLQIIFYVILVGIAALLLGERSKGFIEACEYMSELMMKIVGMVMLVAPVGVFCLIARTFSQEGIAIFLPVLGYSLTLIAALLIHLFVVLMLIFWFFTRLSPITLLTKMRGTQIFAFSTASSSATIPVNYTTATERLGVDSSVASFSIPFGATINMDGTAIMQGVATVFLANFYGIDLGLAGYLTVIGMAVLASIGTAGVPGVGAIMLTMVLAQVGLPIEGIAIILGVDRIMDMIRTAVNITGDAVVTTIVAKADDKLDLSVFDDPNAGMISPDDFVVDEEAEAMLAKVAHKPE